jgi:hypothetical protein
LLRYKELREHVADRVLESVEFPKDELADIKSRAELRGSLSITIGQLTAEERQARKKLGKRYPWSLRKDSSARELERSAAAFITAWVRCWAELGVGMDERLCRR